MASQEIATAYISIVPSLRGVQGTLAKELSASGVAGKAGASAGGAFSKAFGKTAKVVKETATAVVGSAGVAMGVALTKGLGRLNAIDSAKAKLRGLGNDGETTAKIMANALASVKGTAFGLDAAATTAAGAVAAGIQPGKQLESTLKTVANVAAATGRGMDDMGAVFNQVAAGGKAYTMQVKQIADAGLPIWQKLSEELGVTTDQVQKMVTAGEVDFETFERAASAAAGTVAEEMGKTLPGAIDNAWAAVSRFGANVWKGFEDEDGSYSGIYGKLTDLVLAFQNAMGPIEEWGSKIGDVLGEKLGPALDSVTGFLNRFGDAGDGVSQRFKPLMSALAPAGAAFAALGVGGLGPLLGNLPIVGGLLGPLPGMLGAIGGPAGMAAAGLFALSKVDPSDMKQGFEQMAQDLPFMLSDMIGTVTQFAREVVPTFVEGIVTNLPILIDGIVTLVLQVADALVEMLPLLLEAAITLFLGLVEGLVEVIPTLITAIVELIPVIIAALIGMLPVLLDGAIQLFTALIEAIPVILPALLSAVVGLIPTINMALFEMIPTLLAAAVDLFIALVEAIPIIVPELLAALAALGPQMMDSLKDMVPGMIQAGKDLIFGLIDGIGSMASAAIGSIKDLGGQVLGGIKNFFGISSPSKVMAKIGGFLDQGLAGGIGKGAGSVAAMQKMASQIQAVTTALETSVAGTARMVAAQVNAIIRSLQQLMTMMGGAFRSSVNNTLTQVARSFQTVLPNAVKTMVSGMKSGLGGLQSWVAGSFKNALVAAVNAIRTAFLAVPSAVTSSWGRIRSGTAVPTNYVISTVYMRGIRAAVNSIASAVGVKTNMPPVSTIGYAQGGVLPGYTPGRDVHDFYNPRFGMLRLSGGEGILRPEVVRSLGGAATINAWNRARGPIGSCGDRGYASGGIIDFLRKGASGWGVDTGGDFMFHAIENPKNTITQLVTNPARDYASRSGGGDWGRAAGGSMVNLAGSYAAVFSRLAQAVTGGGTGLVAAARKAIGFPYVWGGSSMPPGLDCSGLVYWAYQQLGKKSVPRLTAAGYRSAGIPTGSPKPGDLAFNSAASHVGIVSGPGRMVHAPRPGEFVREQAMSAGMNNFARMRYDNGGWLMPGLTVAENLTGKPEAVFTGHQLENLGGTIVIENLSVDFGSARSVAELAEYLDGLGNDLRMRGVRVG